MVLEDVGLTNSGNNSHGSTLYIHDVRGLKSSTISPSNASNDKNANATGSIVIEVGGFTTPTAFSNVPIQKILRSVHRQGIYTGTNWCRRPAMTSRWNTLFFHQWDTSMGFMVRDRQLYDIGGDSIVVKDADLIEPSDSTWASGTVLVEADAGERRVKSHNVIDLKRDCRAVPNKMPAKYIGSLYTPDPQSLGMMDNEELKIENVPPTFIITTIASENDGSVASTKDPYRLCMTIGP